MTDTREVRTFASELKFLIRPDQADRVRAWARQHLEADPHGGGAHGDEYETTTLYFDTPDRAVERRQGSYGRSKYRVRRYGASETAFLERKLRQPGVLAKRRTVAGLETLGRLRAPEVDETWNGAWFQERLIARRLLPVCQVSYCRMARTLRQGSGIVRLTLDVDLAAQVNDTYAFSDAEGVPVLSERAILEMKFRYDVPGPLKRLVEALGISPEPASKYRLGLAAAEARLAGVAPAAGADSGLDIQHV